MTNVTKINEKDKKIINIQLFNQIKMTDDF